MIDIQKLWANEHWRAAFQRWWDEDYSWEGLANKPYWQGIFVQPDGEVPDSLQDYWRGEADGLISFAGRQWTQMHLPPCDRDGNPCPADTFDGAKGRTFETELRARLKATIQPSPESMQVDRGSRITDPKARHASFDGVVFRAFVVEDYVVGAIFATFESALFLKGAWFERAAFSGDARFESATFSGRVEFRSVTFSGAARFELATFSGEARFISAKFSGDARYDSAMFCGDARFESATFSRDARFESATFSRDARFESATFSWDARFDLATFSGDAWFASATFSGDASFRGTKGQTFVKSTSFGGATFQGDADFGGRVFLDRTDLLGAKFKGLPLFHDCMLHHETFFEPTNFIQPKESQPWRRLAANWKKVARENIRAGLATLSDAEDKTERERRREDLKMHLSSLTKNARKEANRIAKQFELAYRTLRGLSAANNNIEDELMFYGLELDARRSRTDVTRTERWLAWAYKGVSDYGRSMLRPLIWLFALWIGAAITIWGLGDRTSDFFETLRWSPRLFVPSIIRDNGSGMPHAVEAFQHDLPGIYGGMAYVLPLAFVALAALFLIALRRRYQIDRK